MREGYSVTVSKNGEPILTIEREMLSGAELSAEDEQAIRDAAAHLAAFVGPECRYPDSPCTCGLAHAL